MEEISIFVNFTNFFHRSTLRSILLVKCHPNALFLLDTDVFKGPRLSTLRILDSQTHFKPLKLFSIHTSHPANHSIRKSVLSKEKHYVF